MLAVGLDPTRFAGRSRMVLAATTPAGHRWWLPRQAGSVPVYSDKNPPFLQ